MINDISKIKEIQDSVFIAKWWKSKEYQEWCRLANIDPLNKLKNTSSDISEEVLKDN